MKTYKQRKDAILEKIEKKQRQQRIQKAGAGAVGLLCVAALMMVLFLPFDRTPPDVSMYSGSPYYGLIQKLNNATYTPPRYENNFQKWFEVSTDFLQNIGDAPIDEYAPNDDLINMPDAVPDGSDQLYQEVTDNQVAGVTEGDIFKRSDRYIYHLSQKTLTVYTIAGEFSQKVGSWTMDEVVLPKGLDEGVGFGFMGTEMYLSDDCSTVTILTSTYHQRLGALVMALSLDVSAPEDMKLVNTVCFAGSLVSSRMVDGALLVVYNYGLNTDMDFSDESTFVPQYWTDEDTCSVPAENIISPQELSSLQYTVVGKLDGKSLEVMDTAAFLSYSNTIYVSKNAVYTTRSFTQQPEEDWIGRRTYTEIAAVDYTGETMALLGTIAVEGSVKDQYSLDEYEGILRVVTSLSRPKVDDHDPYRVVFEENASLYCIDLSTWEIAGSVEAFAPQGETAQSVRFDGAMGYVCTAEIITMTDPVYFFDLSDPTNITWKDTGTIDGYSSSLIQLGGGYLLGIGYGESRQLKIEVYVETQKGVKPLDAFEEFATFSEVYKSYYIDREHDLIGLGICGYNSYSPEYLLLHFDGYRLREVARIPIEAYRLDSVRATIHEGWLYILGDDMDMNTQQIW